jgi:predicted 2-oxoglutarate/Fe(II)-dependent dioxygenase YbiX
MDRGTIDPAEVFDSCATVDLDARRASSIDVDGATLDAVEATLDAERHAVEAHCHVSLTGREGAGFLRYGAGGFYRRHRDWSVDTAWPGAARRQVSLIVFLNSSRARPAPGEFGGGELIIFPESPDALTKLEAITVVPREGTLVAFDASTPHEVLPARGGTRDVIVDWYY